MKRVDKEIKKLAVIGNWAKSCKTSEQLEIVSNFMNRHVMTIQPFNRWEVKEFGRVMYHLGIVDGIILSIKKLKFKNAE